MDESCEFCKKRKKKRWSKDPNKDNKEMRSTNTGTRKRNVKNGKGSSAQAAKPIVIMKICAIRRKMEEQHCKPMRGVGKWK